MQAAWTGCAEALGHVAMPDFSSLAHRGDALWKSYRVNSQVPQLVDKNQPNSALRGFPLPREEKTRLICRRAEGQVLSAGRNE